MLKPQSEFHESAEGSRIGLALAGGGPLGVIYEIGALRALDEALDGVNFNALHVYVGVSAGSVIAANLVNQLTTADMCRNFILDKSGGAFNPQLFLTPAFGEYVRRMQSVPKLFYEAVWRFVKNPLDLSLLESLTSLSQAIPPGFFDNEPINRVFSEVYNQEGRSNDFRELLTRLYVIAVDLDTGESVKFGAKHYDHIPISKALQASTALPGLYPPVEIEGRYYVDGALIKTMHASVALDEGADLVICLNPIVPFDANLAAQAGIPKHDTLLQGGLPVVLSQTFRSLIHSRLEVSMAAYDSQYDADVILFEPNRDDEKMFFTNVFSFSTRRWVCEHAYQTIRSDLLERHDDLAPILARHGISLRRDILEDKNRHFSTDLQSPSAAEATSVDQTGTVQELEQSLRHLQRWVHSFHN